MRHSQSAPSHRAAFSGPVFRVFAPPSPSAGRCSGTADALWACPRASSRSAAFDCALRFAPCARHFSPSGLRCSQAHSRLSSVPTIRNSRLAALPLASLLCSLDFRFACFAHCARRSSVPTGLTMACFAHCARPSCAPYQFPLKSYGFPGAETAGKRFLLWKMGFSDAKIAPSPPYTPSGTIKARKGFSSTIRHGRPAPSHRAAFSGPVFRGCALRFAPCARHFSPSGLRMLASSLAALPCAHNSQ